MKHTTQTAAMKLQSCEQTARSLEIMDHPDSIEQAQEALERLQYAFNAVRVAMDEVEVEAGAKVEALKQKRLIRRIPICN